MTTNRELSEMVDTIGADYGYASGGCSVIDRMAQPRVMWSRFRDADGKERLDFRVPDYFELHPDVMELTIRLSMERIRGFESKDTFNALRKAVRESEIASECRGVYMMRNGLKEFREVRCAFDSEESLKDALCRAGDWRAEELEDVRFVWGDGRLTVADGSWVMGLAMLPCVHAGYTKVLLEDADTAARKALMRPPRIFALKEVE